MSWISKVEAPHECRKPNLNPAFWKSPGIGSKWKCDTCGQKWGVAKLDWNYNYPTWMNLLAGDRIWREL